ncbi:hypothetical protein B0H19DRAFT_1082750 [Mycena capillaripes]|nr:hypothetical protein B0H19DRAFT_1082750 [Mycena capillaripes]
MQSMKPAASSRTDFIASQKILLRHKSPRSWLRRVALSVNPIHHPAAPGFSDVVDRVSSTVNIGVELAYRSLDIEYLPSFAHTREFPLLEGPNTMYHIFTPRIYEAISELINLFFGRWRTKPLVAFWLWIFNYIFTSRLPQPWAETPRPHSRSTPLARSARNPASHPPGDFRNVYEARCEISSGEAACEPLRIVNNGSCLVVPSMTGHRQRTPILAYYVLDDVNDEPFSVTARYSDVGLSEIAYAATTDEERKLIFVADDYRIKSYAWADRLTGEIYESAIPTHTLASPRHTGPLAVLTSGTLLRAGEGSAAVWNLDGLPTHGGAGNKHIGRRFKYDGYRGDYDDIEDSSGSPFTSIVKFADSTVSPAVWYTHPGLPATMLCTSYPAESEDYSFISLDLEHGGKTIVRYFGNGGGIGDISISKEDPNAFATGASDGHARLYDTRFPLPVLTFCAGTGQEDCGGVALIHPDGIPDQVIGLWDIRARKMVYELSTGNNSVNSMTWDETRNALYVSTTCSFLDGNHRTYRRARLPPSMLPEPVPPRGMLNDDDGPFDKCWPRRAIHSEGYWGEVFDAGYHRIFRYAFKEHPQAVTPAYGSTTIRETSYY